MLQEIVQDAYSIATDLLNSNTIGAVANLLTIATGIHALLSAAKKGSQEPELALE